MELLQYYKTSKNFEKKFKSWWKLLFALSIALPVGIGLLRWDCYMEAVLNVNDLNFRKFLIKTA